MRNAKQIIYGLLTGLLVVIYCCLVALFMGGMDTVFSGTENNFLVIFPMLLLLVFSAAVAGSLVFGYPAYLFINKKFQEGLYALGANVITIIFFGIIIILGIFLLYK